MTISSLNVFKTVSSMKSVSYFLIPLLCVLLSGCDDNTSTLGVEMMPGADMAHATYRTYSVETNSYSVGNSVLARSSISYLGRFTDPETGTLVESDFLAQFHCNEDFSFPDEINDDYISSVDVSLFVNNFVGDSLSTMKISVYPLNVAMDPNANYYTDIDPNLYYDKESDPIAVKWFTLSDRTIDDTERWNTSYKNHITVTLPREYGQMIYDDYKENPQHFTSTSAWINSGLPCSKGLYFKLESGDGAIAAIDILQLNINFRYYDDDLGKDTTGICQFASTEEVVQATRFQNKNIDKLLSDKDATYLKTPAGVFTEVVLPIDEISTTDTINTAILSLTRYNDVIPGSFKLGIPQTVLLVRLDDYLNGFFENYELVNNQTSFIATFNSNNNSYTFSNISRLITKCIQEKIDGIASENYNKLLVIPVEATYSSTTNSSGTTVKTLVKLNHDFSVTSAKLVGGSTPLELKVIYSRF